MPRAGRPRRSTRPREELGRAVAAILAKARREAGLTRGELALRSGVSINTLIKIERSSTTDPGFTVVAALADALSLSLDALVQQAQTAAPVRGEGVATGQPITNASQS